MTSESTRNNWLVLSYLELRASVGAIGILLPFVLAIGKTLLDGPGILQSLSAYYYSDMGNVFVGSLSAIGVFLWSYRGYDWRDILAGHLAAISAIGVALFPTAPSSGATSVQTFISGLHAGFAGAFFLILAYFAIFLFRQSSSAVPTQMKIIRNYVYLACGIVILICVTLVALSHLLPKDAPVFALHPTFYLESLAIVAFGISWFVKGDTILKDE